MADERILSDELTDAPMPGAFEIDEKPTPPRKRRGRKPKTLAVAPDGDSDEAGAAWGALFMLINSQVAKHVPPDVGLAQGKALHRAVMLTWPDTSPVAVAWGEFAGICAAAYVVPLLTPKLPEGSTD